MMMECKYGGGLFLEFQPLTGCMVCYGGGRQLIKSIHWCIVRM